MKSQPSVAYKKICDLQSCKHGVVLSFGTICNKLNKKMRTQSRNKCIDYDNHTNRITYKNHRNYCLKKKAYCSNLKIHDVPEN